MADKTRVEFDTKSQSGFDGLWHDNGDGTYSLVVVVSGPAATGAAVSGNPLLNGGKDSAGNAQPLRTSSAVSTNNVNAPAANTAAVITYAAAGAGVSHVLSQIAWSYSGTPTGGNIQVQDGANVVFNEDITSGGPGVFVFTPPLKGSANTQLVITLAAGGAGVSGKVNAPGKWAE